MNTLARLLRDAIPPLTAVALVLTVTGPAGAQPSSTSTWAMYHHDVRHSGQSGLLGPLFQGSGYPGCPGSGCALGATDVKTWQGFDKLLTSFALSPDGKTIYAGLGFDFCAIDITTTPTMTTKWCTRLGADVSASTPTLDENGFIYMGDRDNSVNKFDPSKVCPASDTLQQCHIVWRYNNGHEGDVWTSLTLHNGGIYFSHDQDFDGVGGVTALNADGTLRWKYLIGTFIHTSSPTFDSAGIMYLGDTMGYLHAFQETASTPPCQPPTPRGRNCGNVVRIWKRKIGTSINASPVVSADSNTLYVGSNNGITALDISHHDATDGVACPAPVPGPTACRAPRWTYPTAGYVGNTPALDSSSGTLYFGTQLGNIKTMYALNSASGSLKPGWLSPGGVPGIQVLSGSGSSPFPIVAADGTVYWGIDNGVRAYSPNGTLLWTFHTTNYVISSPIIGVTAGRPTLFVGSLDRKLYAISSPPRGSGTNHPPVAHASANPTTVIAGTPVAFNGSTSTDPDHNTLSYSWDFNDPGSGVNNTASVANPTHTYSTPNTYLATLTVSDGFLSDTDQVQVTVNPIQGGGGGTFTDDFNRCTTTPCVTLGGPNPPPGPQWGEVKGNLEIKNGQLMINVDDPSTLKGDNIAVLPLSGATQAAEADFTSVNNSWGPRFGVVLRYQDAGNYYLLYRIAGGTVALRISKVVNGVETVLASKPIPPPVVIPPTAFHLRGAVSGDTLTVTLGPNQAPTATLSVTPASTLPGGSLGILLGASFVLPYSADNFAATAANP